MAASSVNGGFGEGGAVPDAEATFNRRHQYELGWPALTHRKTVGALVGTPSGRLIESIESDFLPVKPGRADTSAP